ncbi:MAG TPA: galactokinase [Aggregatilinea sp.]|jgi:galactokinase|uniref:galactokinase n=1 Tax=Aggregatilinea sp. TaxID=2806333 RepID=UPI002BD09000|nr:galactokinase [Aggregatilinea sp.]HML21266.1 galactokinase [Aggregatilinea sp.]
MVKTTGPARLAGTTSIPQSLLDTFAAVYPGRTPDVIARAPGRVNLLGGHVDIHEGLVLNIAIDRDIWLAAARGDGDRVRLHAANLDTSTAFSLAGVEAHRTLDGDDLPRWAGYAAGVAWALQRLGLDVSGIDGVIQGSVLMRAGLSSSAAVEIAYGRAWQALGGWTVNPHDLVLVGQAAEREYMGLGTGVQDQYTVVHALQDHALTLDCRTLEHRHNAFTDHAKVVICDTNTRRELVGSSYNTRARDAHDAAAILREIDPAVKTLRDASMQHLDDARARLTPDQFRRAKHVITEIARVRDGAAALDAGDSAGLGALMNDSYWSARDDYGSSSPALDAMWQAASSHPGCHGARYSGGGEAGAIVALVDEDAVEEFIAQTASAYTASSAHVGSLFAVEAAQGASVLD